MPYDPLSSSTRSNRRWLLGVSAAAIVVKAFGVTIDSIPAVGLDIKFDAELLPFVLGAAIVYFLISFCMYIADDLLNAEEKPYTRYWWQIEQNYRKTANEEFESYIVVLLKRYLSYDMVLGLIKEIKPFLHSTIADTKGLFMTELKSQMERLIESAELPQDAASGIKRAIVEKFDDIRSRSPEYEISGDENEYRQKQRRKLIWNLALQSIRIRIWEVGFPLFLSIIAILMLLDVMSLDWLSRFVKTK
ncbi:MAG: hypothetical protein KAK01_08755 [Candidatus Marinimicrobia bacterium]|nr:hypothetical protein [Candidatus Neomarinimicrobiota bacterium]